MTLLLATAIGSAMAFAYSQVRQAAVAGAEDRLGKATLQVSELLQISVTSMKGSTRREAQMPAFRDFLTSPTPQNRTRAQAALNTISGKSTQIVDIRLWDSAGNRRLAIWSNKDSLLPPVVRRELLAPLVKGDSGVIGSLHMAANTPVYVVGAPIVEGGRTIGYLVERGRLAGSARGARALGELIGNGAGVYLGNAQRDIWTDFWIRANAPPAPIKPGKALLYTRSGAGGGPKYALEKTVPGTPWLLLVEFPRDVIAGPVAAFLRNATLFALVLLALGALMLWIVSRNITGPLSKLREAAMAFTEGKHSARLAWTRKDELGQLSQAFDIMAARVTEAQDALKKQLASIEHHNRILVDGIQDYAIFMLDPTGRVVSWNKGAERIKGYEAAEIIGEHFSRFYSTEDIRAKKPWRELAIAQAEGRFENEGWRVRKDGSHMWATVVITALFSEDGTLIGFAKITRDISERKMILEAEAAHTRALEKAYLELDRHRDELKLANEDLEGFTYSVSHDLRAPIRQIEGFSKILGEHLGNDVGKPVTQYLQRIQDGAQRMGRLVDDLLNLAQLGQQVVKPRRASLDSIVGEVVADLRADVNGRDIEWRVGQLPEVVCDPGLMRVVFTNLLSNAVKYTRPRAKAVIEVGAKVEGENPLIYVRDNGVGFDAKYSDKLFGVFQRLHRAEDFEGTGVGLATVHRVIRKHNGSIWADAAPDKGATFFFTLGTAAADEPTETR
jgi:PAS domain S-box-containing protein